MKESDQPMGEDVPSISTPRPAVHQFRFRDLGPGILMGTASDRYAGWVGQIYTRERYEGRIGRRSHAVGGQSFVEETLPVESVAEYFEHFSVLEIDFTFYSPLLDQNGDPTRIFHVLKRYREHMEDHDRVVLKVPQLISARKIRRGGGYVGNETYLDPGMFRRQFYEPAVGMLGPVLSGMIFEQEYQRKDDRVSVAMMAENLDRFFEAIPEDTRYHIELRTEAYLGPPVFQVLNRHGIGQVLSHWTWLPRLKTQLARGGNRVFNSAKQRVIRLMTPIGMRYEEAYARAHPFDRLVDGMLQREMVDETADLMREAVQNRIETSILINNRAGGNAPLIAQRVAETFLRTVGSPDA
jgi:uncharacterized protein YecE (DUF72 family)